MNYPLSNYYGHIGIKVKCMNRADTNELKHLNLVAKSAPLKPLASLDCHPVGRCKRRKNINMITLCRETNLSFACE